MSNKRKGLDDNFKKQIVNLYKNGKSVLEIKRDYNISRASVYKWFKEHENTGSFKASDNRTEKENDLIRLKKENKQLRMENDILKQAALIIGRKS